MRPACCSGISECTSPRPAVIHCTLPGTSTPSLPWLSRWRMRHRDNHGNEGVLVPGSVRSEEHTSELQSQSNLVCRLLLEIKKRDGPVAEVRELRLVAGEHGGRADRVVYGCGGDDRAYAGAEMRGCRGSTDRRR